MRLAGSRHDRIAGDRRCRSKCRLESPWPAGPEDWWASRLSPAMALSDPVILAW